MNTRLIRIACYKAAAPMGHEKLTRSTLCADIARRRYGPSGIFFGLNDVF